MSGFYPLAAGNEWVYQQKDGSQWSNKITAANDQTYTLLNSIAAKEVQMKKEGDVYLTDAFEAGQFVVWLKDNPHAGDTWDVQFKANGLDSILTMTIKETGVQKEVAGKTYADVMQIEAESKISMNGQIMALNFFTQYYYAAGVGLVLTTSSAGDSHELVSLQIAG